MPSGFLTRSKSCREKSRKSYLNGPGLGVIFHDFQPVLWGHDQELPGPPKTRFVPLLTKIGQRWTERYTPDSIHFLPKRNPWLQSWNHCRIERKNQLVISSQSGHRIQIPQHRFHVHHNLQEKIGKRDRSFLARFDGRFSKRDVWCDDQSFIQWVQCCVEKMVGADANQKLFEFSWWLSAVYSQVFFFDWAKTFGGKWSDSERGELMKRSAKLPGSKMPDFGSKISDFFRQNFGFLQANKAQVLDPCAHWVAYLRVPEIFAIISTNFP